MMVVSPRLAVWWFSPPRKKPRPRKGRLVGSGTSRRVSHASAWARERDRSPAEERSGESDRKALRKLHQTLQKITEDFETRWHFNTSIASLMELVNEDKREDFGKICIAQRDNALSIPHAMMKKKLTLDEYMSARPIADPIHLFDCVMPCAGAEAFVVCREDVAKSLNLPRVRILSTIERHNAFPSDPIQIRGGWELDVGELWSMAALEPKDIDFVETYDDYPVISMMQFEDLGFCAKGEGPDFVRSHTLTNDGTFPHNTSGGQLSVGQAGAAGGFLGIVEAMRQLTSQPLGSQVPDAKACLVSGFGMINYDRGLSSCAAVFARAA